jgi:outer membrane protein assembly factor BamB
MPSTSRRFFFPILALALAVSAARADDWPQWFGPKRDCVWRETGLLDKFPEKGIKAQWRTPIGAGYAGPAVAGGKVYVTDRLLDKGVVNPANPFGRNAVSGTDRVLCLDEKTGEILWKHEYPSKYEVAYPAGPRTTPIVQGGKVYALGTMGELLCLDAAKGTVLWSKDFAKDFNAPVPQWGFSASPLLDGDRLICLVGGKDHVAVAFDKENGKVLWHALTANEPGYCPPMIFDVGGKRQLIIWHPQAVNGLDPESGKVLWSEPFAVKAGLTIPTPRLDGNRLFVSSFYNGSMMLQFKADDAKPTVLWKGKQFKPGLGSEMPEKTEGLHCIMSTPILRDGHIYGVCSYGELRCLKADTGERVWQSLALTGGTQADKDRWNNAFIVPQGDRFFFFTEKGDVVIGRLTPRGYEEVSRTNILKPDNKMARGRLVIWSHPAFAGKCIFARNDHEIVCVSLAKE